MQYIYISKTCVILSDDNYGCHANNRNPWKFWKRRQERAMDECRGNGRGWIIADWWLCGSQSVLQQVS